MGKVYDGIGEKLAAWIEQQHLFFVATAPLAEDGHVNISPKGDLRWFRILGPPRSRIPRLRRQRRGDDRARTRERPHRRNVLRVRGPAEDRAPARPRVSGAARRFDGKRSQYDAWLDKKVREGGLEDYVAEKNAESIDGLPAI